MIAINVRMFAMIKELTGIAELHLSLPEESTVDNAFTDLASRYPALNEWRSHVRFAVNNAYVDGHHRLSDSDEVALIPPVSGG